MQTFDTPGGLGQTAKERRLARALLALRLSVFLVMLMCAVSTFSSYRQYLDPFDNLLFLAAWPMLGACFALYTLRDLDTIVLRLPRRLDRLLRMLLTALVPYCVSMLSNVEALLAQQPPPPPAGTRNHPAEMSPSGDNS